MRYYFLPIQIHAQLGRIPKYVRPNDLGAGWAVGNWDAMDYGLENVMLVALDLSPANHTTLAAQGDVLVIPVLTNTVTAGARPTVIAALEGFNLPGQFVTVGQTYKQVLSRIMRPMQFMQRYHRLFGRLFAGGVTLDTTINQIPVNARTRLAEAAQSMGAVTSGIVGTTLVRDGLLIVGDQLLPGGLPFAGDVF